MENIFADRIEGLRAHMRSKGMDAVIVRGSDPHASEYPSLRWKQVEWLTGFTGEAADVVVTPDHAGLWTDTRFFIQALSELEGSGVELHRMRVPQQVGIPEWLSNVFASRECINLGIDPLCNTVGQIEELENTLSENGVGVRIVSVADMLSSIWDNRPRIPQTPIVSIECGESVESKIDWLRGCILDAGCSSALITSLDSIAWLLNVRGGDIDYNPLVISYLHVGLDFIKWFVVKDEDDIDPQSLECFDALRSKGVEIAAYEDIWAEIAQTASGTVAVDISTLNYALKEESGAVVYVPWTNPIEERKAVKNDFEIEGMRKAHLADALAMEIFLYKLENAVEDGDEPTEWDASVMLGNLREGLSDLYRGDSFSTIAAYGPSAALPHYCTPPEGAPVIEARGLFLCDSGAQYECGTTDITRTVPMGECTPLEKEDYTLVLKGHIDLAMAVFPVGTAGCQIDALAREPLWRCHRNFGHGTGHGVGYYLCVHEGPQDLRQNFNKIALKPGMILSDEPGIYREGMHGVRHENLLLCVESGENEFGQWLSFEPLTLCHFDTGAILVDLLTSQEREWLNAYNAMVYDTLKDLLPEQVAIWLKDKTSPI